MLNEPLPESGVLPAAAEGQLDPTGVLAAGQQGGPAIEGGYIQVTPEEKQAVERVGS